MSGNPTILVMIATFAMLSLPTRDVCAQGSRADYERAGQYEERTRGRVFRDRVQPQWLPGVAQFWYRVDTGPNQREFIFVDAERAERRAAFDPARLAAALQAATGQVVDARNLPFRWISLTPGATQLQFAALGKAWKCDLQDYSLVEENSSSDSAAPAVGVLRLERPHRSRQTGEETFVRFVNRTAAEVQLSWIDTAGQRRPYATLSPGQEHEQHTFAGHVWIVADGADAILGIFEATPAPGSVVVDGTPRPAVPDTDDRETEHARPGQAASPDGQWLAFIRDHNVVLKNRATDQDVPLTRDGNEQDAYRPPFCWSPDSQKLVVLQATAGQNREIHLIESSPPDQLHPKLRTIRYDKPGDRLPIPRPRLLDVTHRQSVPIDESLFSNAWSCDDVRWHVDSSRFTFLYNQRGHQVLRFVEVDATTGAARAIVDEQSPTFVDYANKQFAHYADATREIVWMSERDGWNHLYLIDADTGQIKNPITHGPWVVRGVERVDEQSRQIWFLAGGIRPGQDPYFVHLGRVNFDGTGLTVLTEGDGTHQWSFAPDGRWLIDSWSRVDQPPVTELRSAEDGRLICELERADWSRLLETGWRPPERFVATGRDGTTDIYGILVRPTRCDADRRYPVIEKIYAGPQAAFVPKAFGLLSDVYSLAELGFIVVQIDGMGTSYRSKTFHDVCYKNLVDAGFPDRILWLQAAAATRPEMDLTRVGIFGGSAGGQNALGGLLTHGDFYHVGVADCGCHDNRMDKVWWNELWMGWPVGPHYEAQSNGTLAHKLQGKLLLIVGELDDNVDPASTLQVVHALIEADKDFDLLVVPGTGHGAAETAYGRRRRMDFFVRHLLHVEPRWEPQA